MEALRPANFSPFNNFEAHCFNGLRFPGQLCQFQPRFMHAYISQLSPRSYPIRVRPPLHAPVAPHRPQQTYSFTNEDLDFILYGCTKRSNAVCNGHAISGLMLGDLNHGIDRILSCDDKSPNKSPPSPPSNVIDPTGMDLPMGLVILQTTCLGVAQYGVFCMKTVMCKGTRFGPFTGRLVNPSEIKTNDDNTFMWEIFSDGKLSHFIDGRGAAGKWMSRINSARCAHEQNLITIQDDQEIFYEVCKDIPQGTELLVWYGDCYLQFMGVPVALKDMADGGAQEEADSTQGFSCDRCGKVFAYKYYRDKHLKYTRCVDQGNRKYKCHLCSRSFEKRDRLRIHILHVHEKYRPHKCLVCSKSFSQSSSLNKHMRVSEWG